MISICICTYNRAPLLERMLGTLAQQEDVDWCKVEVIVIDNNCTDATADVTEHAAGHLQLRRVVETEQGLSHARNRALQVAKGDWIVFTDDDVILGSTWLSGYLAAFDHYPDIGFAGGRIEPEWPNGVPAWYRGDDLQLLDGVLVRCSKGERTRLIETGETLFVGASFAIRADVSARVGKFRVDLGVNGEKRGLGEETDYLLRTQRLGLQGLYVAGSQCQHPVDPRRLTMRGLFRYGMVSGEAHRAIVDASVRGSWPRAVSYLARGGFQLLKGRGDRYRECVINAGVQAALRRRR